LSVVITEAGRNIALISFGIVLLSTLVRYFTVDMSKVKENQRRIKEHQEKLKEAQKKGDKKRMQKHQEDMLAETMESFRHNMKPMFFTLIPIILIFGWMTGTYGDYWTAFNVTLTENYPAGKVDVISVSDNGSVLKEQGSVVWHLGNISSSKSGMLSVSIKTSELAEALKEENSFNLSYQTKDNKSSSFSGNKIPEGDSILSITRSDFVSSGDKVDYKIRYENNKFIVKFGSYTFGWLGWYIIISFASSIILNKLFKLT
jgi:uncharacterized membrane protein (DUF106 family)